MHTLDQVLENALQLPDEQQQMLIEILQNRSTERRREEIATDAQKTLADFRAGKFEPQPVEGILVELRQALDEPAEHM